MNRIRLFFLILFILVLTISCGQEKKVVQNQNYYSNPLVADSITYGFVNAILSQNFKYHSYTCNIVLDKVLDPTFLTAGDSITLLSMDSLFSHSDVAYVYEQFAWSDSFKLNPALVRGRNVIQLDSLLHNKSGKSFYKAFVEKYGDSGFCNVSMPLFSEDKSIAIVKKGMLCGRFCGEEETLVYRKINGEWMLIYTLAPTPEY